LIASERETMPNDIDDGANRLQTLPIGGSPDRKAV
jgi:hypothetical protein